MKDWINVNLWRMGHLNVTPNASDFYYVKLARKLYDIIRSSAVGEDEGEYMCQHFAMMVTYYFEDVVSEIGIWKTFTSKHKELYGKYLPFYDLDEDNYYQDEINFEDVCFLLWMALQKEKQDIFLNPENPYLMRMAVMIYAELDAEFENAPINAEMLEHLRKGSYEDFFFVKGMLIHLEKYIYLFQPFMEERQERMEHELEGILADVDDSSFSYAVDSIMACCEKTGPLSLYAKDWLAGLLSHWGMAADSERVAAIEALRTSVYLLKSYDSQNICLEDIKEKEYVISRTSFRDLPDETLLKCKTFISSLAKYDGEWQVNGLSSWSHGRELFDAYKENVVRKGMNPILYDKMMKANQNHPMFYFKDYEEMLAWFDKHIGLHENFVLPEQMKAQKFLAVYLDKEKDMSVVPEGALSIKDKHDPYYNKEKAEDMDIELIVSADVASDEMLHFLIENNMLPDACINSVKGKKRGKQLVQDNMDFIARFMRESNY